MLAASRPRRAMHAPQTPNRQRRYARHPQEIGRRPRNAPILRAAQMLPDRADGSSGLERGSHYHRRYRDNPEIRGFGYRDRQQAFAQNAEARWYRFREKGEPGRYRAQRTVRNAQSARNRGVHCPPWMRKADSSRAGGRPAGLARQTSHQHLNRHAAGHLLVPPSADRPRAGLRSKAPWSRSSGRREHQSTCVSKFHERMRMLFPRGGRASYKACVSTETFMRRSPVSAFQTSKKQRLFLIAI